MHSGLKWHKRPLILTTIFAIAMAFIESAVVVYLRKLYYPEGFEFPLVAIPNLMAFTELGRELATLVMLVVIGLMMGKNGLQKFAYFLYSFAVWDIFYYLWLKVIIDWPASLLTKDILFLIPLPWTGPVLVPVLASLAMILLALVLILSTERLHNFKVKRQEWIGLILGSTALIIACIWDYSRYVITNYGWQQLYSFEKEAIFIMTQNFVPTNFPWPIFLLAKAIIILAIASLIKRGLLK